MLAANRKVQALHWTSEKWVGVEKYSADQPDQAAEHTAPDHEPTEVLVNHALHNLLDHLRGQFIEPPLHERSHLIHQSGVSGKPCFECLADGFLIRKFGDLAVQGFKERFAERFGKKSGQSGGNS